MSTEYAIPALYLGILSMTPPTRNLFYKLKIELVMRDTVVGHCIIGRGLASDNGQARLDNTTLNRGPSATNSSILEADSATRNDPEDPRFSISWTLYNQRINSKLVFLAAIDGIALAARSDASSRCSDLVGVTAGVTEPAVIHMTSLWNPSGFRLTYKYAARAMQLITQIMQTNRFAAMRFDLKYDGAKCGEGIVRQQGALAIDEA